MGGSYRVFMRSERIWRAPLAAMGFVLAAMALNCALALSMKPAEVSGRAAKGVPLASSTSLAVGTILPIRVNKTISKKDAQVGQSIEAEIMQDVPLANREKIHAHAHVNGTIVSIAQGEEGAGFQVSLRFDKIEDRGEIIPMATRIRTLASFLAVQAALAPLGGADSG